MPLLRMKNKKNNYTYKFLFRSINSAENKIANDREYLKLVCIYVKYYMGNWTVTEAMKTQNFSDTEINEHNYR